MRTHFFSFLLASLGGVILLLAGPGASRAAEWTGSVETVDGIEIVHNPAQPLEEPLTLSPRELWRVGGDSEAEEEFFGVIGQVATDAGGNLYLLDQQLSEVRVFSPDGQYLRTIGREGEGPGEFRQALDMCFLANGNLGVLQLVPGRLVMFTPDGEPAGDHPLPRREGGAMPVLIAGQRMGDNLLLLVSENAFSEGYIDITRAMTVVSPQGEEIGRLIESTRRLEFVNFLFKETAWRTFDQRWRVGPNDDLYAAEKYLGYEIGVWGPDRQRKRLITREFEHFQRSDEQKKEMYDIFDAMLQDQLPQYTIEVSDCDPDINQLFPQEDGTLWVLSSRGARERPEGAMGIFDVFDAEGRFVRQVTVMCQGRPMRDGYFFRGNRLYVVTDLLEANIASHGGRKVEDGERAEEPEPVSVICYELPAVLARM